MVKHPPLEGISKLCVSQRRSLGKARAEQLHPVSHEPPGHARAAPHPTHPQTGSSAAASVQNLSGGDKHLHVSSVW